MNCKIFSPSADHPLLVFGGPYSNAQALKSLLDVAEHWRIPSTNLLCTGDLVAYCADPVRVVETLRALDIACVQGNCEESLAENADDCGCGFNSGSTCDTLSAQWYAYASQQIDSDTRTWMASLPKQIRFEYRERKFLAIHGGLERINQFVFASSDTELKQTALNQAQVDAIIGGHCGLPFTQFLDNKIWHNPGVIGLPANDGTPRVWYSILEPNGDTLEIQHHALEYDFQTAAKRVRTAKLPEDYAASLSSGLWPALDILPAEEQTRTGIPISETSFFWKTSG